jgi:hypothetical protein
MNEDILLKLRESGYKGNTDLSSLLEACGEKIESLEREDSNWLAWSNGNFESSLESDPHFGSTPEEAVAKLWLALNRK